MQRDCVFVTRAHDCEFVTCARDCVFVTCARIALCLSEGELEEVLTTYTKLNKSASIFLGSNTSSSVPTKPAHNPVPAPSLQRAEMLHRRREGGDVDSKGSAPDDPHRGRGRSSSPNNNSGCLEHLTHAGPKRLQIL